MAASRKNGVQRRDEILDAALACFVSRGVLAIGIEEIRKRAGASPSSMYHHFAGITDIVVALVARIAADQYAALATAAAGARSVERAVRAIVEAQLAWTFTHPREARFMYQAFAAELAGPDRKRLEAVKLEHRAALDAALAPWLAGTELASRSTSELAVLLLGATHQACRLHLAGGDLDAAWMRATLPDVAWRGVAGYLAPAQPKRRRPAPERARRRGVGRPEQGQEPAAPMRVQRV